MVGDGAEDLLAARAAGCGMALAEWGYGHGGIDASEPRLWRVRTPAQLLDCAVPEAARRA
jgi:phosphoglycolate phosphatase